MADLFTDVVIDDVEPWFPDPAGDIPLLDGGVKAPWLARHSDVSFTVLGTPQQQSSKNYMSRPGGGSYGYVQNKKLKPWRALALVAAVDAKVAREEAGDRGLLPAAVFVRARFYYSRPASHYGTGRNAGVLKPNAPVYKESKPDTDNLQKAVGDVLTQAGIIRDDVKVVHWDAAKMWSDHDRVEVSIWSL